MTPLPRGCSWRLVGALVVLPLSPAAAQWQAAIGLQERVFAGSALGTRPMRHQPVLVTSAAGRLRWTPGAAAQVFSASAWLRLGLAGGEETLVDLDELNWHVAGDRWELRVGVTEVFWGVLESAHLVDVINQRAPDAGSGGDVKLGQPLVAVASKGAWGRTELYLLPWFRPRPLGGRAARWWVDAAQPGFPSGTGGWSPDWAARWTRSIGDWDVGIGFFDGTNREPAFEPPALVPRYHHIRQLSLDAQWTAGVLLWKLEAATRDPPEGRYASVGGGVEYAPTDYFSVLAEYLYDSRAAEATTSFEHDLLIGARLLHRDGRLGVLGSIDPASGNATVSLDLSRRLGNALELTLEGRAFLGDGSREPPFARRLDTSLALGVNRYF